MAKKGKGGKGKGKGKDKKKAGPEAEPIDPPKELRRFQDTYDGRCENFGVTPLESIAEQVTAPHGAAVPPTASHARCACR